LYDNRETDYFPTKSGVIGMIAAALGRKRNDDISDLTDLKFGVRIDFPGTRIQDFQVTNMGDKLNANLSNRVYLCDAIFLVGLSSDNSAKLQEIENALNNPIYSIFLGRRSCPPTQPLNMGIKCSELYQALLNEEWLVPEWRRKQIIRFSSEYSLRIIIDSDESSALKKDVPVSFSPLHREYRYRYVKEMKPKVIENTGVIEHDPMEELR
jgi:CRISPR system Cascade subunit CasD